MKKLKFLSVLVCSMLVLVSCEKPETDENQPQEPAPTGTAEPRIDLIRKVIRYNAAGSFEDSVRFKYDSQNRISQIEFGPVTNGKYYGQIRYVFSKNQAGRGVILEKNLILNSSGNYDSISYVSYTLNADYENATYIQVGNNPSFQAGRFFHVYYDSLEYITDVVQTQIKKQMDYYLDYKFKTEGGNITEARADSYPGAGGDCNYEYYPQPYNHDLFISVLGKPHLYFWGIDLENVFDIRHKFLGKRNQNLVRKAVRGTTVESFEYEFNSLGLVSKIKTATVSSTNGSTPMATRYELFYY